MQSEGKSESATAMINVGFKLSNRDPRKKAVPPSASRKKCEHHRKSPKTSNVFESDSHLDIEQPDLATNISPFHDDAQVESHELVIAHEDNGSRAIGSGDRGKPRHARAISPG